MSVGPHDEQSLWIQECIGRVSGVRAQLMLALGADAVNGKEVHRAVRTAIQAKGGRIGFRAVKATLLEVGASADKAELFTKSFNKRLHRSGDHAAARKKLMQAARVARVVAPLAPLPRRRLRGKRSRWGAKRLWLTAGTRMGKLTAKNAHLYLGGLRRADDYKMDRVQGHCARREFTRGAWVS